ncbi:hypothetical protein MHU86_16424 [Fragilaria crotonensis]|nr:hypothetical protein MHU86_16424 [Fragilaria crotonensis]
MACSVYFLTKSKVTPIPTPFSKGSEARIDYGGNKGSGGDGGGGGGGGDSDLGGGNPDRASSNTTKHDSILDHLTDAMAESTLAFTPFFFHVPRSGGQTVKDVVGLCLLKTQASEVGIRDGHQTDAQLQIVTIENAKYVNVDTTTKEGIERAAMMGFAQAQLAEMVTSSYFLNSAQFLFSEEHPGRAFIMFRNPIHVAVSMYYYQRSTGALDERITLEEFARGNGVENNWMTRSLTNAMEGELRTSLLYLAKKILIKKFLVGFLDDIDESVARLIKYMGWKYDDDEAKALLQQECIKNRNPTEYELPKRGSQSSALLSWHIQFDMLDITETSVS